MNRNYFFSFKCVMNKKFKIVSIFILFLLVSFVCFKNNLVYSLSDGSFEMSELGGFIFMEVFVTIHMCVFFLMPISKLINERLSTPIFISLFIIRVIMLIIGDIINPVFTAIADFLMVFFGAFIIVPVAYSLKGMVTNGSLRFSEYPEIDDTEIQVIGYNNASMVIDYLFNRYIKIKEAYSDFDFGLLTNMCSKEQYILYKNNLEMLKELRQKNIFSGFNLNDAKVYYVKDSKDSLYVSIVVKMEYYDYIVDDYNKVISGSKDELKEVMCELSFRKDIQGKVYKECPNCGASLNNENLEKCSYCDTLLNFNIGEWVLSKEKKIKEK